MKLDESGLWRPIVFVVIDLINSLPVSQTQMVSITIPMDLAHNVYNHEMKMSIKANGNDEN